VKEETKIVGDAGVISELVALGAKGVKPEQIHSIEDELFFALWDNGKVKIEKLPQCKPTREHTFGSLEGFLDYLNSDHCANDKGIVFVGQEQIFVNLAYKTNEAQEAKLPLKFSDEYQAMRSLADGVKHKALWQLLITKLHGCMSPALLLAIGQIKITGGTESQIRVDITGITDGKQSDSLRVSFAVNKGEATADIPMEWTWKGRIWEQFGNEYEITLRLEIEVVNGALVFRFHPRRPQEVLRQATQDLVAEIKKAIPKQFTAHEGSY